MTQRSTVDHSEHAEQIHAEAQEVAEESGDKTVLAFIETPKGSRNKYEYDKEIGALKLDRVLFSSVHYPADYGFIPDTLWEDGDPLDILVLVNEATFPGCLIDARPIGGLDMADEKGGDFKVLAVPTHDPRYDNIHSLADVSPHILLEIANFFETYKLLERKETEIRDWHDAEPTRAKIKQSRELYRAEHPLAKDNAQ